MDLAVIFQDFLETVATRTADVARNSDPITEDTLCFYIAASFMTAGHTPPHLVEMEIPHPAFKKEKGMQKACDVRVFDGSNSVWLEVKFDKEPPSKAAMNMTNRHGKLVNDLMRTASIPNGDRLFLYVTTTTMLGHLARNDNPYLGNKKFMIDGQYVEGLPKSAKSEVKDYVLTELGSRKVTVEPLHQGTRGHLRCFLYGVSRS